jgi:serine/threonine-protein kinase
VLRQDPDPGEQASKDDAITLIVSGGPGQVTVPSVKNTRTELAIRELEKAELKVTADQQPSDTVRKGFAIGTSPKEGDRVERGSRVRLFVSSGPEQATVPDVVGLTRDAAETRLTREGLDVRVQRRDSDEPEDDVIQQTPAAGTKLDKGEQVTIVVSEGQQQVDVPNLVGLSEADARRLLRGDKLGITVRRRNTDNEEEDGQVLDQRPGAGVEVDEGRSVIVIVGRFEAAQDPTAPGVTPEESP